MLRNPARLPAKYSGLRSAAVEVKVLAIVQNPSSHIPCLYEQFTKDVTAEAAAEFSALRQNWESTTNGWMMDKGLSEDP